MSETYDPNHPERLYGPPRPPLGVGVQRQVLPPEHDASRLTREERNVISSLRRLGGRWPDSLRLVVSGHELTVYKRGVSIYDIEEATGLSVEATNSPSDIHDDMDFGRR